MGGMQKGGIMSSRKYSGILAIVASVVAFASQATVYTQ